MLSLPRLLPSGSDKPGAESLRNLSLMRDSIPIAIRPQLQNIQPSSILHFPRDILVHSPVTLVTGCRLSSAPMGG